MERRISTRREVDRIATQTADIIDQDKYERMARSFAGIKDTVEDAKEAVVEHVATAADWVQTPFVIDLSLRSYFLGILTGVSIVLLTIATMPK